MIFRRFVHRYGYSRASAQALQINTSTVRKHLENIYRKLRVQSRTEAVAKALEQLGTLNLPPVML